MTGTPADDTRTTLGDELTRFQIDLLVAAARLGRGASGQDIKRRIVAAWGTSEAAINHGRLYSNLDVLVDAGLLTQSVLDRRTNEYRITDAGREVLRDRYDWLATVAES
jgi:DNA-binding PadR family transcriptional regulator